MELGIIGLGQMGGNMAERLRLGGHKVVGFDFSADAVKRLNDSGSIGVTTLRGPGEEPGRSARGLDYGAAGEAG